MEDVKGIFHHSFQYFCLTLFQSLLATLKRERPDIEIPSYISVDPNDAIPEEMPLGLLDKEIPHIEGIGQPTTACLFTTSKIDPKNW